MVKGKKLIKTSPPDLCELIYSYVLHTESADEKELTWTYIGATRITIYCTQLFVL